MNVNNWAQSQVLISYAEGVITRCVAEIDGTYPLESGGVLMGSWKTSNHLVIDAVVGPGPRAEHGRYHFSPNLEWQHARIAELFAKSRGKCTYLGDWHSHPGARHGGLSNRDRAAIETIIFSPEAQCPEPLMAIFWGIPGSWALNVWQGRRHWPRIPKLRSSIRLVDFRAPNNCC